MPFLYQEEMVDCGRPERSASWYSDHPLASRSRLMISKISVTISPPLIFRLLYFEKSLHFNNCCRIIYYDNNY